MYVHICPTLKRNCGYKLALPQEVYIFICIKKNHIVCLGYQNIYLVQLKGFLRQCFSTLGRLFKWSNGPIFLRYYKFCVRRGLVNDNWNCKVKF